MPNIFCALIIALIAFSHANANEFDREFSKGSSFCQGYHPSPKPLVKFSFEARKKGDVLFDESVVSSQDLHRMWKASYYFNITLSQACFSLWNRYMDAWVATYKSNGNPIDEDVMEVLILSYAVMRGKLYLDHVTKYDRFLLDIFYRNFEISNLKRYGNFEVSSAIWDNNWESIRLKNMILISYALQSNSLTSIVLPRFFQHFHRNLRDGVDTYDFLHRDSINYSAYSAVPLLLSYAFVVKLGEIEPSSESNSILTSAYLNFNDYASGRLDRLEFLKSKDQQDVHRLSMSKKSNFFYAKSYICLYEFIFRKGARLDGSICSLPLHIRQFYQIYDRPDLSAM